ncbi:MAG: toll/interleukin-1 receptor domain-containing protein [Hyphomicrobiales bacterium]
MIKPELENRIRLGKDLERRHYLFEISTKEFGTEFHKWNEYNILLIERTFNDKELLTKYERIGRFKFESSSKNNNSSYDYDYKRYSNYLEKKINKLEDIIDQLPLLIPEQPQNNNTSVKKIFISHSSKDKDIVKYIIKLLRAMNVRPNQIFCTSFDGYGIELGEDYLKRLKTELNDEILVLFILSENFYKSEISLCEMGATWVKTNQHIPILIPPFDFKDMKGVIPTTQGMKIDDGRKVNSLKSKIKKYLSLEEIEDNIWESDRNEIITEINSILDNQKKE